MLFCSKLDLHQLQHVLFFGDMDESLEHIITSCHYSKQFLAEVIKWFDKQGITVAQFSNKDIILGIVRCGDELLVNHVILVAKQYLYCLLYTSPSPRDGLLSRMPSSA